MKTWILVLIIIFASFFIFGFIGSFLPDVENTKIVPPQIEVEKDYSEMIGSQIVYEKIDNLTDCTMLQNEFDIAMDNTEKYKPGESLRDITFSYAKYTLNRMDELNC